MNFSREKPVIADKQYVNMVIKGNFFLQVLLVLWAEQVYEVHLVSQVEQVPLEILDLLVG
jgi:hypothetical protein